MLAAIALVLLALGWSHVYMTASKEHGVSPKVPAPVCTASGQTWKPAETKSNWAHTKWAVPNCEVKMPDELPDPVSHSWDEYITIAFQRRWWIVLSIFVCWAAAWGISLLLPATYESEATVLVERQKVPDQYVTPNVTADLQDRLQNITEQILSRTRLQALIDYFHLYPRPRGLGALLKSADPVAQMRRDIEIHLVETPGHPGEFSAFRIRYSAKSPEMARKVNGQLTSLFVSENVQTQRQLSENTTDFLESQLADARSKMEMQESQVAAFKERHAGELPSQLESNVQILAGIESQLANTQHALDAAKQQKIYLESLQQQYVSAQAGDGTMNETQTLSKDLRDLRHRLQNLSSLYTDGHPDIVALRDQIAKTEKELQEAKARAATAQPTSKDPGAVEVGAVEYGSTTAMMQIQSQLKANQMEIQNDEKHQKDFESQIATYQARLNLTPETEQELTDISRGYEEAKSNYNSLLQKQMQSQLATSLDQRQQGEQFRIIDPATLPLKPSAPDRLTISLAGLFLGVFCGVCIAAILEVIDSRVRYERDLGAIVSARILVALPRLTTQIESRVDRAKFWAEFGAATAMALLVVVGNLYVYYKG
jgi:polysaccharide chain length determinant protein (PEP-CTERM system associated)